MKRHRIVKVEWHPQTRDICCATCWRRVTVDGKGWWRHVRGKAGQVGGVIGR